MTDPGSDYWDFSKLPDDVKYRCRLLVETHNWAELLLIHNEYQISANVICCDDSPIKSWFKYAYDNNLI